jgi:hypothetical protein
MVQKLKLARMRMIAAVQRERAAHPRRSPSHPETHFDARQQSPEE